MLQGVTERGGGGFALVTHIQLSKAAFIGKFAKASVVELGSLHVSHGRLGHQADVGPRGIASDAPAFVESAK